MTLCVTAAGKTLMIAATTFSLSWTHSVEKTEWQENWAIEDDGLVLKQARVKGSGAGMDPGQGARLEAGWWIWEPDTPRVASLNLATSGTTVSGWKLCHGSAISCIDFDDAVIDQIRISTCKTQDG